MLKQLFEKIYRESWNDDDGLLECEWCRELFPEEEIQWREFGGPGGSAVQSDTPLCPKCAAEYDEMDWDEEEDYWDEED